jgi:hypothetical protein
VPGADDRDVIFFHRPPLPKATLFRKAVSRL